jgi:hypothetical protein
MMLDRLRGLFELLVKVGLHCLSLPVLTPSLLVTTSGDALVSFGSTSLSASRLAKSFLGSRLF